MGVKMDRARAFKRKMDAKWEKYTGPLNEEVIKEMEAENEEYAKLAKAATLEWLGEEDDDE